VEMGSGGGPERNFFREFLSQHLDAPLFVETRGVRDPVASGPGFGRWLKAKFWKTGRRSIRMRKGTRKVVFENQRFD